MTVRAPVPPSDFRSPPQTLEDLRKLTAYLKAQNEYLESRLGTGAASSIRESGGATLAVGSVPDGGILTRVGSSVVGRKVADFPVKASPTTSDKILISDAAASDANSYATVSSIVALGGGGGGSGIQTTYSKVPAVTGTIDDEFASGSPDLAVRGWTCINASTGVTMTRVGDVSTAAVTSLGLTAAQYRSTLTASGIAIQCTTKMHVHKAMTGSFAIMSIVALSQASTTAYFVETPTIWHNNPPFPDINIMGMFINVYNSARNAVLMNNGTFTTIASRGEVPATPYVHYMNWNDPTNTCEFAMIESASDRVSTTVSSTAAPLPSVTASRAGFGVMTNTGRWSWAIIRAIRTAPLNAWPGLPGWV